MIFLIIVCILLLVGGVFLVIAGAQLTFFYKALTGEHMTAAWIVIVGGVFLCWLAYYLSPLVLSVKVSA